MEHVCRTHSGLHSRGHDCIVIILSGGDKLREIISFANTPEVRPYAKSARSIKLGRQDTVAIVSKKDL
jgi:hypothetical protein